MKNKVEAPAASGCDLRMGSQTSSGSRSGEEDGDTECKAAIKSIAAATPPTPIATNGFNNSFSSCSRKSSNKPISHSTQGGEDDGEHHHQPQKLKSHQIKVLAAVMNGLGSMVRGLWGLQERRFFATFDAVMSAAVSLTMALVVCLLSSPNGLRAEAGVAYI